MSDLISRQAAIDRIRGTGYADQIKENIIMILMCLPSARPSGSWIHKTGVYGVAYCSECDYELHSNNTNFCPHCGARMKGADDDSERD